MDNNIILISVLTPLFLVTKDMYAENMYFDFNFSVIIQYMLIFCQIDITNGLMISIGFL